MKKKLKSLSIVALFTILAIHCSSGEDCDIPSLPCENQCVDLDISPENCGECGNVCADNFACIVGTCTKLEEVEGVFLQTNLMRKMGAECGNQAFAPTEALLLDPQLSIAAQAHANDMSKNNFFDHTGSDDSSFVQRIGRTKFQGQAIGENIAAGQKDAKDVVKSWINSPGHCKNLMNPNAKKIGVGYATGGPYGTLWVQLFGK